MSKQTTTTTPAETVAALKRYEIAAAEIVVQSATVARWANYIAGRDVETVHEFKPGDVLTLRDWRPEGMMTTTPDGREMFIFWHFLEAMTTAANVRRFNTNLSALDLAVIEQLDGEARNVGDICEISTDAAEELANVCRCSSGAAGGFRGFIYYTETTAFALANRAEIIAKLREEVEDGLYPNASGIVSAVMSFNCLKCNDAQERAELEEEAARFIFGEPEEYKRIYTGEVANALAWAALENLAYKLEGCDEIAD